MPIRVLDPTVAAQIAAGEVVERPASVIKELLENALDAGARRITVEVRGGGVRELKITDDGCGIPAAEVETAFQRHATSKLSSAADLWALSTLGFRGEALPSIAAVSQVTCVTRAQGEETGTELRVAGGEVQARSSVGAPYGTSFTIRNLFYNVPVRREFLRADTTEASAVAAIVTQYALAYPHVRFTLLLEGRVALQTSGSNDLRGTLVELFGVETGKQLLEVQASHGEGAGAITVRGMVSPPGLTRSSRGAMHLFVNARAIQPRGQLVFVIEDAYHTLLMKGRHPIIVLDIQVPPDMVDVNIHPTKSEVKFRDGARVHSALGRAVRDALLAGGVRPWAEGAAPPPLAMESAQRRFELRQLGGSGGWQERERGGGWEQRGGGSAAQPDSGAWNQADSYAGAPPRDLEPWPGLDPSADAAPPEPTHAAPAPTRLPPLRIIGQAGGNYIIADSPEGLYLVDQHAAHERINYERLMRQRGAGPVEAQELLIPQTVDVTPEARQTLLANAEALAEWGFALEDFGMLLRVRAAPHGMQPGAIQTALLEVAERLAGRSGSTPQDRREAMLTTLACHTSIRAGQALSPVEMRELLDQLGRCEMPRTCPHGRPTLLLITTTQIERQFGRIA